MARQLQRGDHVYVSYSAFTHHGIYIGEDKVVALCKKPSDPSAESRVCRISTDEFADGRQVQVLEYEPSECSPPDVVVDRALSRVGCRGYDLVSNNCEHFATWCKTGERRSRQVECFARRFGAIGAKVVAKPVAEIVARQAARTGSKLAVKAAGRMSVPLLLVGDVVQLGVEHGAPACGLADPKTAQMMGAAAGLTAHAAIGFAVGGPAGALIGAAFWFLGEAAGTLAASPANAERKPETRGALETIPGRRRKPTVA